MTKIVIDAYAWVEYLDGTEKGVAVRKIIEDHENDVYTCAVTIAELVSKFSRKNTDINIALNAIRTLSKIINIDAELSESAGKLHAEVRKRVKDFGLSDAYLLAAARKLQARILTGDAHFKNLKEAMMIS